MEQLKLSDGSGCVRRTGGQTRRKEAEDESGEGCLILRAHRLAHAHAASFTSSDLPHGGQVGGGQVAGRCRWGRNNRKVAASCYSIITDDVNVTW